MKLEVFNKEFNKMFKWFASDSAPGILRLEADIHKKLIDFTLVGDSYYFILNHNNLEFEVVSGEVTSILGYNQAEFNIHFMNERVHQDDRPWFVGFGKRMIEFFSQLPIEKIMKYKVRYDVRFRTKNNEYVRILYQGVILEHDEHGGFLRSLGVHTDITYLKEEGEPALSFVGMAGEPSFVNVGLQNDFIESERVLTRRETRVLALLTQGKSSSEIGNALTISKQTVDTHRKNMLHKCSVKTTGELIAKAIVRGWI